MASGMRGSRPTSDMTLLRIKGNLWDTMAEEWGGKQQLRPYGWPFSWERKKIFCRDTNLRVQRMGWGAGTPTGTWVNVEGRSFNRWKNGEESSGWGRLDGHAIKHGNIAQTSTYNYNGWIGDQADPWGDRLSSRERRSLNCRKNGG